MRTKKKKRKDEIRTLKSLRNNHVIWFQENGRLGMRWSETGEVCIPATYNEVTNFNKCGFAIVRKDDKVGVIDNRNRIRIPFIYDDIKERKKLIQKTGRRRVILDDGEIVYIPPKKVFEPHGFSRFVSDGSKQAYHVHCKPCDFDDEDTKLLFADMNN